MRALVGTLVLALLGTATCGRARTLSLDTADWRLVYPPEAADEHYPKGIHLMRSAPLEEWTVGEGYPSEDACETARARKVDEVIDQARLDHGDAAKFELPVRRAVNARCVTRGDASATPGSPPP